ncbi:MAG: cupin domain-containing protein [Micropruina sp.]
MGKTSRATSTSTESVPGYEGHFTQIGDMTVAYETYTEDADLAPLFVGLPDDLCQAVHYGYVITGKVGFRYGDGTVDEITTGESYVATPGHTPILYAGTEVVEFTNTEQLNQTMAAVTKNMEAAGS